MEHRLFADKLREIKKQLNKNTFEVLDDTLLPYIEDIKNLLLEEAIKGNVEINIREVLKTIDPPSSVRMVLTHPTKDVGVYFYNKLGIYIRKASVKCGYEYYFNWE